MESKDFVTDLLIRARELGASNVHMTVGKPPVIRINGVLSPPPPEFADTVITNRMLLSLLDARQEEMLNAGEDLDFTLELEDKERQRLNLYRQMGVLACAAQLISSNIRNFKELKLPAVLGELALKKNGLVLITGSTGSGKTTTLAAMIDHINSTRACHILTIEDPVEYRFTPKKALIHQREIGRDVKSFNAALRSALREDPDVILVGEMRDYESIQLAITAAETGHLVLGTLHTKGASHTINRIVDACPPEIQPQIMIQLAQILEGVVSQVLLPLEGGKGRIAALEILVGTSGVRNLIRINKSFQLDTQIQGGAKYGMQMMDDCIANYYRQKLISRQTALEYAADRAILETKLI
ncbi:MAG: PilT/PilU family type 4a pilus ATPase [Defluviitaleaceae bacterium]|nr:PilT/PilU family type 4a pilus ATPase [Defluviitaleaceae bacterium]